MFRVVVIKLAISMLLISQAAVAGTHSLINASRSGTQSNVFVSQALEGEYGHFNKISAGTTKEEGDSKIFRGYGIRNTLGVELMKFTQFSVSHTFLDMRSRANSLENLHGSRLQAEARLVFSSPIGNMEAGGGFTASKLDYTKQLDTADYLGSGYFYTLGINYFLSPKVSFFGNGKVYRENMVRNGGSSSIENIKTKTSGLGFGFSLWI